MEKSNFIALFVYVQRRTNNFTIIPIELVRNNPQTLLILRMLLKVGQKEFAKRLGVGKTTLWSYEAGKSKSMTNDLAVSLIDKLNLVWDNANIETDKFKAFEQYTLFKSFSYLDTKRARKIRSRVSSEKNILKGIKTETCQNPKNHFEERIMKILRSHNIPFEFHALLDAKNKPVVVDFVVPNKQNPKIVIEVKQACSLNRRSRYGRLKYYVILLDHKMHHLKLKNPDLIGVLVISDMHMPFQEASLSAKGELLSTDALFLDFNLPELPSFLQSVYQGQTIKSV